jgi:hypothetical protein
VQKKVKETAICDIMAIYSPFSKQMPFIKSDSRNCAHLLVSLFVWLADVACRCVEQQGGYTRNSIAIFLTVIKGIMKNYSLKEVIFWSKEVKKSVYSFSRLVIILQKEVLADHLDSGRNNHTIE